MTATVCHSLVHPAHHGIDHALPVAVVSAFDEVPCLLSESTARIAQFEGPQEIIGFFKVGSNSEDLVDQVFHANDPFLAQFLA